MLRFYWPTVRRTFGILWTATDRYLTYVGIVASLLTFFSPELAQLPWGSLPVLSRWWALVPLLVLFVYGFLKALHERFDGIEDRLEIAKNRRAIKDLLGGAVDRGKNLRRTLRMEGDDIVIVTQQDVEDWVHGTHDLIEAAFDKGEARHFLDSSGYDPGHDLPWRDARLDPYKYYIEPRLKRLDELIVRTNSLEINPDFDPKSATPAAKESTAERLRLESALDQTKAKNEELEAANEHLTEERDTLVLESRRLKEELDGQIRGRCIELTDELEAFLTLKRAMPPEETMRLYREQLKGKVDRLRADLIRLGWWKPREDVKQKLEYPETPDHLLSIYHYVRNIGVGME